MSKPIPKNDLPVWVKLLCIPAVILILVAQNFTLILEQLP